MSATPAFPCGSFPPSCWRGLPLTDVPNFQIAHIESPSIDTVGGFKGVGEGGLIGAVPSIVNAVADALADLDVNVNTKPLRPALLSRLIREAGG